MRIFHGLLYAFAVGIFSTQALADVQSYCEVFGQDFASAKTSDVDQWQVNYRNAFGDCMAQYAAGATAEAAAGKAVKKAARKVVVVPARDYSRKRRIPILEPGSTAWNKYCSAKYASFNQVTGNYKSHAGREKPCLVPSG